MVGFCNDTDKPLGSIKPRHFLKHRIIPAPVKWNDLVMISENTVNLNIFIIFFCMKCLNEYTMWRSCLFVNLRISFPKLLNIFQGV
jgi:hypothetical protein